MTIEEIAALIGIFGFWIAFTLALTSALILLESLVLYSDPHKRIGF